MSLGSEDADPLGEALHVRVLPFLVVGGRRGGRRHQVGGVGQGVVAGEHLPADVVAVVGDVALAQLGLQLPEVQPRLVVLDGGGEKSISFRSEIMTFGCVGRGWCGDLGAQSTRSCRDRQNHVCEFTHPK